MSFQELLASVEEPALRCVALHWEAARGARRMPSWKEINPAAIAPRLPIVWSWKYDRRTDSFTGRLAREEITEAFGKSLRGVPMEKFFASWQYDLIFARHRRVVTGPAFAHGCSPIFIHANRHGTGERIILPLAADGEQGDGILGATIYRITPNRPAARLTPTRDAEQVEFLRLT